MLKTENCVVVENRKLFSLKFRRILECYPENSGSQLVGQQVGVGLGVGRSEGWSVCCRSDVGLSSVGSVGRSVGWRLVGRLVGRSAVGRTEDNERAWDDCGAMNTRVESILDWTDNAVK